MRLVHPVVEPLRKWLSEHEKSLDSTTLGEPRRLNQYLENRLREAFQAGWDAHEKHVSATPVTSVTT
jgi:hypothetical protein